MLEQLDLFGRGVANKEPQNPLEKRAAERKLLPPETIMVDEEPIEEEPVEEIVEPVAETVELAVEPAPLEVEETLMIPRSPEAKKEPREKDTKPGKRGRKSLKEMTEDAEFVEVPEDEILFRKQYYSIGEVAEMFKVNTSLLRYWETEFDILKPRKNRKGDRFFRPEDVKNLQLIYHLLRQRKYTIEGAKDYLKYNKARSQQQFELFQRLQKIRSFLLELKASL